MKRENIDNLKVFVIKGEKYHMPLFEALQCASMTYRDQTFEIKSVSGKSVGMFSRID